MSKSISRISELIANWGLMLGGVVAVFISILGMFGWEIFGTMDNLTLSRIIIGILGIILIVTGYERVKHLYDIRQGIAHITNEISDLRLDVNSCVGGRYLRGAPEVFFATVPLVREAKRRIRAVVFSEQPVAIQEWIDAVNKRLIDSKNEGRKVNYEFVLCQQLNPDNQKYRNEYAELRRLIEHRISEYAKQGVDDQIFPHLLFVNFRVGFDVLIIDTQHAAIAWRTSKASKKADSAILFENEPRIAEELNAWYTEILHDYAMDYNIEVIKAAV
jgi:hypothetical protein